MSFDLIRIGNLRNLLDVEISPSPGINLIFGFNASGKSSLLEAIYLLGRGRSFRDTQLTNLINRDQAKFTIFGKSSVAGRKFAIGVEYSRKGISARLNGERVKKLSNLARATSLQAVTPHTLELIEKGSASRRSMLDWGVFHVEPTYRDLSVRYNRVLAQRNAELRTRTGSGATWEPELVRTGAMITALRESYFDKLRLFFESRCADLCIEQIPLLEFTRGWNADLTLEQAIAQSGKRDSERGFTTSGPHRADILFRERNHALKKWGSRGQIKMVVIALILAQSDLLRKVRSLPTVLLIDDLGAELDDANLRIIVSLLEQLGQQVFITTIENTRYDWFKSATWFHVEHGSIFKLGV